MGVGVGEGEGGMTPEWAQLPLESQISSADRDPREEAGLVYEGNDIIGLIRQWPRADKIMADVGRDVQDGGGDGGTEESWTSSAG